ncbi:hypothetical protein [Streptomyces sp. WM6386]|uniref:hypothetical protein n=1 Tax=Streptomyces sp. WM6386 TaxID=1415558 RepID=UPI0006197208|nr:hypothetical protein [Streptomyces sp. WM6386]KKD03369.1 hypothetical protein TN53_35515 [Streptomyces sp. WM6386]
MIARGRTLKFTAVIALVVLALSGFSTSSKSRHGSGSRSGGGCSSSSQDHDSSSSTSGGGSGTYHDYDDDDDYDDDYDDGYSGGSSGESSPSGYEDGTARLISCATVADPYATIEVTNPNSTESTFDVHINFMEADDDSVNGTIEQVTVAANGTKTMRIEVTNAEESAAKVDHCDLDPVASYNWDDVTGS